VNHEDHEGAGELGSMGARERHRFSGISTGIFIPGAAICETISTKTQKTSK
jgi:hypothetical protein